PGALSHLRGRGSKASTGVRRAANPSCRSGRTTKPIAQNPIHRSDAHTMLTSFSFACAAKLPVGCHAGETALTASHREAGRRRSVNADVPATNLRHARCYAL